MKSTYKIKCEKHTFTSDQDVSASAKFGNYVISKFFRVAKFTTDKYNVTDAFVQSDLFGNTNNGYVRTMRCDAKVRYNSYRTWTLSCDKVKNNDLIVIVDAVKGVAELYNCDWIKKCHICIKKQYNPVTTDFGTVEYKWEDVYEWNRIPLKTIKLSNLRYW